MYEWTLAGLITEGIVKQEFVDGEIKITDLVPDKKYAVAFNYASAKYFEAVKLINTPAGQTLKSYAQSEILAKCFEINRAIFPIALAEGMLDLKDIAAGIGAGMNGLEIQRDR